MTSSQCTQIQNNLVELRTSTKQELDKLHGHLKMTFLDSMETVLAKSYTPAAEFPTITRDMAPDKILSIMNGRINGLEAQMKIQLVTNQILKSSLSNETLIQDRYPLLILLPPSPLPPLTVSSGLTNSHPKSFKWNELSKPKEEKFQNLKDIFLKCKLFRAMWTAP
jgi:hypothetical protein